MKKYLVCTFVSMAAFLLFSCDAVASLDFGDLLMDGPAADAGSGGDVFGTIAVRMIKAVGDLRIFAYIIAGFGMIAFTWGAIFNKINWKHFGNIMFSLFILSMMIPLIEMVVYGEGSGKKLTFGGTEARKFVAEGNHAAYASSDLDPTDPSSGEVPGDPDATPRGDHEHIDRLESSVGAKVDPAAALAGVSDIKIADNSSRAKFADALAKTKETADKIRQGVQEVREVVDTGIKIATAAGTAVRGVSQAVNTIKQVSQAADAVMKDPNASGWDKFNAVLGATSSTYNAVNDAYSTGLNSAVTVTGVFDGRAAEQVGYFGSAVQGIVMEIPGAAVGGGLGLRDAGNEIQNTYGYIQETVEGAANAAR